MNQVRIFYSALQKSIEQHVHPEKHERAGWVVFSTRSENQVKKKLTLLLVTSVVNIDCWSVRKQLGRTDNFFPLGFYFVQKVWPISITTVAPSAAGQKGHFI